MGGSRNPTVHARDNLMALCRTCHWRLHDRQWILERSEGRILVFDRDSGQQIMRRVSSPDIDVPAVFQVMNIAEYSISQLLDSLPYFTDEQLIEAFGYATSFGKRAWLVQAAILYEAQKRSTYGDRALEAIARGFGISLRQAQKYALVWKVFFTRNGEEENVNIDAILLDEPSWYVVAASETKEPEKWLAYAQDRKIEDPRYSVIAFRRDIRLARVTQGIWEARESRDPCEDLSSVERWTCPWLRVCCIRSGKPITPPGCSECEFEGTDCRHLSAGSTKE
jgi:hypothetical protein